MNFILLTFRNVSVHLYSCYSSVLFRHMAKILNTENAKRTSIFISVHQPATAKHSLPVF